MSFRHSLLSGKKKSILNKGGKYFPPVSILEKTFTLNDKPSKILNIIRAQAPYEGGIFNHRNKTFFVKSAKVKSIKENLIIRDKIVFEKDELVGILIDEVYWLKFSDIKKK